MRTLKLIMVVSLALLVFGVRHGWGANYTSGSYAGSSLTTGDHNAFVGDGAGPNITTGNHNTCVGEAACWSADTSSSRNTFVGANDSTRPLWPIYSDNVGVGYDAGMNITTAGYNVFVGTKAGYATTTGGINTFVGNGAGVANIDGQRNVYLGNSAGATNVSGSYNIFIGNHAGDTETGSNRLYIDINSTSTPLIYGEFDNNLIKINGTLTPNVIRFNDGTTMSTALAAYSGTSTTFLGISAGQANSGGYDTFIGSSAGLGNTTGTLNTFVGYAAGVYNTTGSSNTYLGQAAGYYAIGSGNVFVGNGAGYYESGSNRLYISNSVTTTPLLYGEFDTKILQVNGTLVVSSDERLKKNIEALQSSLDSVMRLRGVSYQLLEAKADRGFGGDREIGLIAQEVERVLPQIVHTDEQGYKAVAYDRLVPVLIEAVKEQEAQFRAALKEKDARIERLEQALQQIEQRLAGGEPPRERIAMQ